MRFDPSRYYLILTRVAADEFRSLCPGQLDVAKRGVCNVLIAFLGVARVRKKFKGARGYVQRLCGARWSAGELEVEAMLVYGMDKKGVPRGPPTAGCRSSSARSYGGSAAPPGLCPSRRRVVNHVSK